MSEIAPYMYPRILLTGGTGQVGRELTRTLAPLGQVWAPPRKDCDLSDPRSLREKIRDLRPDLIVNPAAYTAVDDAETDAATAHAVNAEAPGVLAEEAARLGVPLIHYSTDYVFNGRKGTPYVEDDSPNPINVYGETKLAGERAIERSGCAYLILRTSWVYGIHGRNFLTTMTRLLRERESLDLVANRWGSPTWSRTLAEATAAVLSRLGGKGPPSPQVLHLVADGRASWFEFAAAIADMLGDKERACRLRPMAGEDYPQVAVRPVDSSLDNRRFCEQVRYDLPSWGEALAQCIKEVARRR